jgi:hypothetical protein
MRPAISYFRYSTPGQSRGSSEERQEQEYANFCKFHHLEPRDSYIDRGLSGGGKHREGDFGKMLADIQAGKFPKGAVLVIEQCNRLSREAFPIAFATIHQICLAGVEVGICRMGRIIGLNDLTDEAVIVNLTMSICSGHKDLKNLSTWVSEGHKAKRTTRKGLTKENRKHGTFPKWLRLDPTGNYVFSPLAKAMRRACELAIAGHGVASIFRQLHKENLTLPYGRNLSGIFHNRALIGEYQPKKRTKGGHSGKRSSEGIEPITDYYQTKDTTYCKTGNLLSLVEFNKLQEALKARIIHKTHRGNHCRNLFTMMYNKIDNGHLIIKMADKDHKRPIMISSKCKDPNRYPDAVSEEMDYATLEFALLAMLKDHVIPEMLNPVSAQAESRAEQLKAQIANRHTKIEGMGKAMENATNQKAIDFAMDIVEKLYTEIDELTKQMELATMEASQNQQGNLANTLVMIHTLDGLQGDRLLTTRVALKSLITNIVDKIICERKGKNPYAINFLVVLKGGAKLEGETTKIKGKKQVAFWRAL